MILIVVVVATGGAGPPLDDSRRLLAVALSSAPHGVGVAGVILISCHAADDRPGRESRGRPGGRKEGEDRGENNGDSWIMDGMRMHEHEGCLAGTAGTGMHA